jgi:hypothetical protein
VTPRRHRSAAAALALAVGLAADGHAETIDRPDASVADQVERWPSRLCPDDSRASADPPARNDERRTVQELLAVAPGPLVIQYRSPDWSGPEAVANLARAILGSRPRSLSPFVDWAEGADLRRRGFVARIGVPGGNAIRLAVAGYQVCVRDATGSYWYFRNVPGDLWPGSGGAR